MEGNKDVKRSNFLNELLWACSGADTRILRQCPTDYAKYAGIGGTILFTALMAMLSGGYAFYKVFADDPMGPIETNHLVFAIGFGIFWGLLIFNLDRFMVNTMYSDGTPKITKEELKGGLPRIILAFFLGIVISTPIEMRVFQDQIAVIVQQKQISEAQNLNNGSKDLQDNVANYQKEIDKARQDWQEAEKRAQDELDGTSGSRTKGRGPSYEAKRNDAQVKKDIYDEVKSRNEPQIKALQDEINTGRAQVKENVKGLKGFAAELDALYSMNGATLFMARMLVTLLFITIEVIPTLFKMMMASGPYDDLRRAEMHKVRVLSDKRISDINDKVNTMVKISVAKNKAQLEAEQTANKELLDKVALAQSELLQTAIDEWKAEEMKKNQANPSAYIKTSSTTETKKRE